MTRPLRYERSAESLEWCDNYHDPEEVDAYIDRLTAERDGWRNECHLMAGHASIDTLQRYLNEREVMTAERDRLRAALRKMIVALRIQARLALSVGGDIALNEGNASAWKQAEAALPKEVEG